MVRVLGGVQARLRPRRLRVFRPRWLLGEWRTRKRRSVEHTMLDAEEETLETLEEAETDLRCLPIRGSLLASTLS